MDATFPFAIPHSTRLYARLCQLPRTHLLNYAAFFTGDDGGFTTRPSGRIRPDEEHL